MGGIQLSVKKRVNAFGFLHCLGTRLAEELLIAKRVQELPSPCRIGRVAETCVNGIRRAASGTLDKHAENRHSDDECDGTD
jgi:hypothetical protein